MTIQKQNAINAAHTRPLPRNATAQEYLHEKLSQLPPHSQPVPHDVTVRVEVSLPPALVTRVVHFLDAHPTANWDSVAEAALEKYLSTID